jgi:hypothetical protein
MVSVMAISARRIDRKSFAANQSSRDALRHHALKYTAQCIAFAKALVPGTAKH